MFENMASAIGRNRIKPVVDKTFDFTAAPEALRYMQNAGHFGKIALEFRPLVVPVAR
jgi:NADPH:quinone reductase-like Zn-dependent oxidoreductase